MPSTDTIFYKKLDVKQVINYIWPDCKAWYSIPILVHIQAMMLF